MAAPSTKPTPMLCADIIDQEIASIRTFVHEVNRSLDYAAPEGSGISILMAWLESLPRVTRAERAHAAAIVAIIDSSAESIIRLAANALDHASTVSTAFRTDRPIAGSALTLSRGALEAVLQICYVVDPSAQPQTVVLRALAYEVATIEGNEETAKAFGDLASAQQHTRAMQSVNDLHRWLAKSGFSRGPAKDARRSIWIGCGEDRVNIRFNATDATRDYLYGEGYFYSVLSGAAHSRGWMLTDSYVPDDTGHVTTSEEQALVATIPLLDASETLVRSLAHYIGLDPKPLTAKTHLRRRALLAGAGRPFSPMSLDDYRGKKRGKVGSAFRRTVDR